MSSGYHSKLLFEKVTTNELLLGNNGPHMHIVASLVDHGKKITSCCKKSEFSKRQLCLLTCIASYKFAISPFEITALGNFKGCTLYGLLYTSLWLSLGTQIVWTMPSKTTQKNVHLYYALLLHILAFYQLLTSSDPFH